jgi:mRNA-degrading endonuclease toxin of MazEF toxin-antitoxin module
MPSQDYTRWHILKSRLDSLGFSQDFHEREIWWTAIGQNIGSEENGKGIDFVRPVLILRKFNRSFFLGVPASTTPKTGRYYAPVDIEGKPAKILLSQVRALDGRRLQNKIGTLNLGTFAKIQHQIAQLIEFPPQ